MARGEDTGHHPGRRVDRDRFVDPGDYDLESFPDQGPREIAADWHGGQSSGLYSYASAGTPNRAALREIDDTLEDLRHHADRYGGEGVEDYWTHVSNLNSLRHHIKSFLPDDEDEES